MEQVQPKQLKPRIWAVGGGKGGVGKSVICTNIGVALAKRGYRCILVDADLGGANLHTMVGIPTPAKSLTELFTKDAGNLSDVQIPTGIHNLSLIIGAHALLDIANPKHQLKQKIIRQLLTLDADIVLLDPDQRRKLLDSLDQAFSQIVALNKTTTDIPRVNVESNSEDSPIPDPEQHPGAYLRWCRQRAALSLKDLSKMTKLSSTRLEDIEMERFDSLPAPVFVRGYIAEYVRYLNIDKSRQLIESYIKHIPKK